MRQAQPARPMPQAVSSKLVYCLRDDEGGAEDLHLIDLADATPTDVALTSDGKSCDPSF